MIFITLGTQDKHFQRLLFEIEKLAKKGIIDDEIIVQAGSTKFKSEYMDIFDYTSMDQFAQFIKECNYLITHGGVGSILAGLDSGKKVIAVARLEEFGEHENNHQIEIIKEFHSKQFILGCLQVDEIEDTICKLKDFQPKSYQSNNKNFCMRIKELIES